MAEEDPPTFNAFTTPPPQEDSESDALEGGRENTRANVEKAFQGDVRLSMLSKKYRKRIDKKKKKGRFRRDPNAPK